MEITNETLSSIFEAGLKSIGKSIGNRMSSIRCIHGSGVNPTQIYNNNLEKIYFFGKYYYIATCLEGCIFYMDNF